MSNWFRSRHSPTEKERAENQEVGLIVNFLFLLPDDTLLYPITLVITFPKLSRSSSTVSSSVSIISLIACQPINRSVIRLSKITRFNYSRSSVFVFQFRKCRVSTYLVRSAIERADSARSLSEILEIMIGNGKFPIYGTADSIRRSSKAWADAKTRRIVIVAIMFSDISQQKTLKTYTSNVPRLVKTGP